MDELVSYLKRIRGKKILITEKDLLYMFNISQYVSNVYLIDNINELREMNVVDVEIIFLYKSGAVTNKSIKNLETVKEFIMSNDPSLKYHVVILFRDSMSMKNGFYLEDISTQVYYLNLDISYVELCKKLFLMIADFDVSDVCGIIKRLKENVDINNVTTIGVDSNINIVKLLNNDMIITKDIDFEYKNIVIVDRRSFIKESVNLLLSPRSFEGVISEFYKINFRYTIINNEEVFLDLNDSVYSKIYGLDISDVPMVLKEYASYLRGLEDKIKYMNEKRIINKEMTSNLATLVKEKKILSKWLDIVDDVFEKIKNTDYINRMKMEENVIYGINKNITMRYLNDSIDSKSDLIYIYRLLALMCNVQYINLEELNEIKNSIIQTYGYGELFVMDNYLNKLFEIKKNFKNTNLSQDLKESIIFYIGGCSYLELSENNIIFTDRIMNGSDYIKTFMLVK